MFLVLRSRFCFNHWCLVSKRSSFLAKEKRGSYFGVPVKHCLGCATSPLLCQISLWSSVYSKYLLIFFQTHTAQHNHQSKYIKNQPWSSAFSQPQEISSMEKPIFTLLHLKNVLFAWPQTPINQWNHLHQHQIVQEKRRSRWISPAAESGTPCQRFSEKW